MIRTCFVSAVQVRFPEMVSEIPGISLQRVLMSSYVRVKGSAGTKQPKYHHVLAREKRQGLCE